MDLKEALEYEIKSSRFAQYISWDWLQDLVGKYYAKKTKRKYARYLQTKEIEKYLQTLSAK